MLTYELNHNTRADVTSITFCIVMLILITTQFMSFSPNHTLCYTLHIFLIIQTNIIQQQSERNISIRFQSKLAKAVLQLNLLVMRPSAAESSNVQFSKGKVRLRTFEF